MMMGHVESLVVQALLPPAPALTLEPSRYACICCQAIRSEESCGPAIRLGGPQNRCQIETFRAFNKAAWFATGHLQARCTADTWTNRRDLACSVNRAKAPLHMQQLRIFIKFCLQFRKRLGDHSIEWNVRNGASVSTESVQATIITGFVTPRFSTLTPHPRWASRPRAYHRTGHCCANAHHSQPPDWTRSQPASRPTSGNSQVDTRREMDGSRVFNVQDAARPIVEGLGRGMDRQRAHRDHATGCNHTINRNRVPRPSCSR